MNIEAVVTGYTNAPILHGVSVTVAPGEVVAVLGANGAGKTTLLRAASGGVRVWSGRVQLNETDVTRKPTWVRVALGLAHVPEGRHVFGGLTVAENLSAARIVRRKDGAAGIDPLDVFPALRGRLGQLAGTLSGGQQQMLALARALGTSPTTLVVDEMSAGLAPVVTADLVAAVSSIARAGVGVLLVEQNPEIIADIIDRVYLLDKGEIVRAGSLDAVGGVKVLERMYLGLGFEERESSSG